jgi:hypothetical protein
MRKAKITVTFDAHNLPCVKMKNTTASQILDTSVFLNGVSRQQARKKPARRQNKIKKFFKVICAMTKETATEKRIKKNFNKTVY